MRFDTIIIGAGLAGMTAAIRLAESGAKVAVVSAGRSALLFNTGSFGLLGFDTAHNKVNDRAKALTELPEDHPYSKIGAGGIPSLADEARALLERCGLAFRCSSNWNNHDRISPLGIFRPAWLTLDGLICESTLADMPYRRAAVVGLAGFLDFYPRFIAASLRKAGYECDVFTVDTPDLQALRASETEMRAVNIERTLHGYGLIRFAEELKKLNIPSDATLILPSVIDKDELEIFNQFLRRPFLFAPTLGVSLPGISIHNAMVSRLKELGGRIFNGHRVNGADYEDNRLTGVTTDKLDDDRLVADNYIFAAGSFFSHGLMAEPDSIVEPVLGLDVDAPQERSAWFTPDLFGAQPVMKSGVATDGDFKAKRDGKAITNLYAVGSVLSGADSVREDSGAGVAMLTALRVADSIIKHN
ncbi:MAG: glycerol-3-phosphate dehydrogenase subunit GlpB [Muribaculaceae bacterium]|nr:glycerol-3-phosphate dehydrogenase subunit GlpB [Muribaculaceae bacterium]